MAQQSNLHVTNEVLGVVAY